MVARARATKETNETIVSAASVKRLSGLKLRLTGGILSSPDHVEVGII
jgi:hypothetical protein